MPDDADGSAQRRDRRAGAARAAARAGGVLSLVAVLLGTPAAGSVAQAWSDDDAAPLTAEIVVVDPALGGGDDVDGL